MRVNDDGANGKWAEQELRAHVSNHNRKQSRHTGTGRRLLKILKLVPGDILPPTRPKQPPTGNQVFKCPRLMVSISFKPPHIPVAYFSKYSITRKKKNLDQRIYKEKGLFGLQVYRCASLST